jgi:hypothetical protein
MHCGVLRHVNVVGRQEQSISTPYTERFWEMSRNAFIWCEHGCGKMD